MSEHVISIGACGWQYPAWNESYYPEGLPEDWQLAYYGNEYPVVLIPDAYWALGRSAIDVWLEETDVSPSFICECAFGADSTAQDTKYDLIAALGERVKGILIPLTTKPDASQVATIKKLAEIYPVCLEWSASDHKQLRDLMQDLAATPVSVCWHGEPENKSALDYGALLVARVNTAGQTPKSLRTILEALLASTVDRQAVLLFDGQPPDLQVMQQAGVILDLL